MKIRFEPGCRHCGYELRGRRRDDVCSECGKPVRDTWNDRTLFQVPLDTRERLQRGLRRMGWAALSFIAVGIDYGYERIFIIVRYSSGICDYHSLIAFYIHV